VVSASGDDRLDILARVTTTLNTDLEGATYELDRFHEELQNAHTRIAQLQAQLAGQQPPEKAMPYSSTTSPPHKRIHYNAVEATTRLGWDFRMPTFTVFCFDRTFLRGRSFVIMFVVEHNACFGILLVCVVWWSAGHNATRNS
jgi:hypothetical protein